MIQMAHPPIQTSPALSLSNRRFSLALVLLLATGSLLVGSIPFPSFFSTPQAFSSRGSLPRQVLTSSAPQVPSQPQKSIQPMPVLPGSNLSGSTLPIIPPQRSAALSTRPSAGEALLPQAALPARDAQDWQNWPVVPQVSERMLAVYADGLALGNNPHAFTKVGDGEISALWFLTDFDLGTQYYNLGANVELNMPIDYFGGSFSHVSQAARRGFNTTRILDPLLANPEFCAPGETPLECELHHYHPSFALVSLGTNQVWAPEVLEPELRQIIETLIAHGVVPVLSTKADNLEGDYRINKIIAQLAVEYDVPLWNFWRAVQPLPNHGMQADLEHLTYAPNNFADPLIMEHAWPVRNLTALQVLEALCLAVR